MKVKRIPWYFHKLSYRKNKNFDSVTLTLPINYNKMRFHIFFLGLDLKFSDKYENGETQQNNVKKVEQTIESEII